MATLSHCAYCFEILCASLDRREPLSLHQVDFYWNKYAYGDQDGKDESRIEGESEDESDFVKGEQLETAQEPNTRTTSLRHVAISRLLSSSSTPSSRSSSSSVSTTSPAISKSSSRSSLSTDSTIRGHGARPEQEAANFPLFVTWNTIRRGGSRSLRGCIGTFEAQHLDYGLRSYAITSAFEDSRFNPITTRELPTIEVGVTLLTDFEPAPDPLAWEIGKHGLRISFTYHSRRYGATYLPDVPRDQGWTKEETLISLMRKAGWNGRKDDWRNVGDLRVITYQGRKVSMDYLQWKDWRDWVDKCG